MIVHGYVVPEKVEMAIVASMKGEFTAGQLTAVAIKAGAPEMVKPGFFQEYCASRIVDRMLRRHKNAGQIEFNKGVWTLVKYKEKS